MDYELHKLASKLKQDAFIPFIAERLSSERLYRKQMRQLIQAIRQAVQDGLLASYALYAAGDDNVSTDEMMAIVIGALAVAMDKTIAWVRNFINHEIKWHTSKFVASVKKALGIDVSPLLHISDTDDLLDDIVERNVSLIKNISEDTKEKIRQAVLNAKTQRKTAKQLKADIEKILTAQGSRAELIAEDQTIKLTADLNEYRQRQAGITHYRWTTKADGRVRPLHQQLSGKIYEWGEPTGAEGGLPPGRPIRCRCRAVAVVKKHGKWVKA